VTPSPSLHLEESFDKLSHTTFHNRSTCQVNKHISRHCPSVFGSLLIPFRLQLTLTYSHLLSLTLTYSYPSQHNAIHLPLLSIQIIPPSHGLQQPNDLRRNGNGYEYAHQPRHGDGNGNGNAISSPYCRSCPHCKSCPG
jgi:hypothetical protein